MDTDRLLDLNVLQSLRDSGDPTLIFLRVLLDVLSSQQQRKHPQYEQLVFHCATGFRHVVLCRWESFSKEFQCASRDFLLSLGLGLGVGDTSVFPRTLLMTSLHAAATFWKKCWCDDSLESSGTMDEVERTLVHQMRNHTVVPLHKINGTAQLLDTVEALLRAALQSNQLENEVTPSTYPNTLFSAAQAATFLINLVTEFSGSSFRGQSNTQAATYYNSSLEAHRLAHNAFESTNLLRVLHMTMNALGTLVTTIQTRSTLIRLVPLTFQVISLTCEVLSWDFGSIDGGRWGWTQSDSAGSTTALIRPPEEWRDYVIRPDFLSAIFQLYSLVRPSFSQSPSCLDLGHVMRQLILLLSSVTGIIFLDNHQ